MNTSSVHRTPSNILPSITAAALTLACTGVALAESNGTAIVRTAEAEYTIPITCRDAQKPEMGVSTEPSRITREATGRTSGVHLNIRPWKETGDMIVSLDRYVAWMPSASSSSGKLELQIDMSPVSFPRDNMPVMLTYDMWMEGERPEGLKGIWIQADCSYRDPEAPKFQKL